MFDHRASRTQAARRRELHRRLQRASLAAAVALCMVGSSSAAPPPSNASAEPTATGSQVQLELLPPLPLQIGRLAPVPARGLQMNPYLSEAAAPELEVVRTARVVDAPAEPNSTPPTTRSQTVADAPPVLLRPAAAMLSLRPISAPEKAAAADTPAAPRHNSQSTHPAPPKLAAVPLSAATEVAFVTPAEPPKIAGEGGDSVVHAAPATVAAPISEPAPADDGIRFSISDAGVHPGPVSGQVTAADDGRGAVAHLAAPPRPMRPSVVAAPVAPLNFEPEPAPKLPALKPMTIVGESSRSAAKQPAAKQPVEPQPVVVSRDAPRPMATGGDRHAPALAPYDANASIVRKTAAPVIPVPPKMEAAVDSPTIAANVDAPSTSKSPAASSQEVEPEGVAELMADATPPRPNADKPRGAAVNADEVKTVKAKPAAPPVPAPRVAKSPVPSPRVASTSSAAPAEEARPSAAPASTARQPTTARRFAASAATDRQPVVIAATAPPKEAAPAQPAPQLVTPNKTLVIEVPTSTDRDATPAAPLAKTSNKKPEQHALHAVPAAFALPATATLPLSPAASEAPQECTADAIVIRATETQTITPRKPIRRVMLEDREVCEAVLVGPHKLLLIGRRNGATRLAVWSDDAEEPALYQIKVGGAPSAPNGLPMAAVAERLTEAIAATHPGSQVQVVAVGEGLQVTGHVFSEDSAREIMRLVRRACLTSVEDSLEIR